MKKTFVKVALLSMMLTSMPLAMTSCKDYDDDITEINGTTSDLSSQIEALKASIQANQDAAKAAHDAADAAMKAAQDAAAKGDQAEADAQKAMAMAKAAEEAAANAKAEALAEIAKQAEALQALIGNNANDIKKNADAIAALLGRIEGVEDGLGKIDIEGLNQSIVELNTALEAVNVQLAALEGYKTRLEQLESQYSELKSDVDDAKAKISAAEAAINEVRADILAIQADILGVKADINDIKSDIEGVNDQIEDILSDIDALSGRINANKDRIDANEAAISALKGDLETLSSRVSAVESSVNTIISALSRRLTSVTLKPSLYVGGIPTIEFKSAKYQTLQWGGENVGYVVNDKSVTKIVSNNETTVEYRLNPTNILASDIKQPSFVTRIADTRAGDVASSVINVAEAKVTSDGTLIIKAGKSNTESLNLANNQIYTVALKVPIAPEHLLKDEASANVYSEYTRLAETYFQPELRKTEKVSGNIPVHFNTLSEIYAAKMNELCAARVQYNKTLDLNTLVSGCAFVSPDKHTPMSLDDLKSYGLEVSYVINGKPYNTISTDKANQQEFATISGSTFTPGAPGPNGFLAGNQAAIGKQPIVNVLLKDMNNGGVVVDSKYFKILITREDPTPLPTFQIVPEKTADLGCENYEFNVTWNEMTKYVLTQFPNNGISKEDFVARYGSHYKSVEVTVNGTSAPALAANVKDFLDLDNTGASVPVMTFKLTNAEVGHIAQGDSKEYVITLTYSDPDLLSPDCVIVFKVKITNNIASPKLGKTDGIKWVNETMMLYPVPYGSVNAKEHAEYLTNIFEGRLKPYVTEFDNTCMVWNLDFNNRPAPMGMRWQKGYVGFKDQTAAGVNSGLNKCEVWIDHNAPGIALVESEATVKLDWKAWLNGLSVNEVTFANSYLKIVKPLKDPQIDDKTSLSDKPYIQTIKDLDKKLTLYDAYDEIVAKTDVTDHSKALWGYYGVQDPIFGGTAGEIVVTSLDKNTTYTLAQLNMRADIDLTTYTLTFQNNGGVIQNDFYLKVPVLVKHYWGELKGDLYILIKHTL